ncbi:2-hydroxy-3-oxopropionate reductase [Escherichia coli]|nr:2-hydroxy-3-oxopropionate reductase [Escherichia coli]
MKLGFIGLGIMGTPMAINLARAGHQLHVTTIGPVADELLSLGAVSVETARQVTEASDGNDSNLLIVFYVQIMPDDFVMQLHRF